MSNQVKINRQKTLIIFSFYLFIFSSFFSNYLNIKLFDYVDELIGITLILYFILSCLLRHKIVIYKNLYVYINSLTVVIFIGLISNYIYKIQPWEAVLLDLVAFLKFFLCFLGYYVVLYNVKICDMERKIVFHIKLITKILFLLSIIDMIFHVFSNEVRWGRPVLTLFYGHSTTFGDICIFLLILFLTFRGNMRRSNFYIIGLVVCSIFTMRLKIIASVFTVLAIYIFVIIHKKKINISKLLILAMLAIVIASNQIILYFSPSSTDTARSALLNTSFIVAKDYFPIGSGFGTYASSASEKFYSSLYYKYNLNRIYGLHGENTTFISDIFWPALIAQIGVIGTIVYIYMLIKLFFQIQKVYEKNLRKYFCVVSIYIYMIISTLSTSAYLSATGVMMSFGLALILSSNDKE